MARTRDLITSANIRRHRADTVRTAERESLRDVKSASILSRLGSAAVGFISGGPVGAITGAVTDPLGRATGGGGGGGTRSQPPTGIPQFQGGQLQTTCDALPVALRALCRKATGGGGGGGFQALSPCPSGTVRVGDNCVAPGDAFPGGDPFITGAGGQAVQGAFGLPASTPTVEQRQHRTCPDGMVLGRDNLCYPKQVLRRNSRFRKWKSGPRPKISASEWKTLRKAERVRDEAKEVAKTAGFKVTKR